MSRNLLPSRCERCPLQSCPIVQGYGPGDGYVVVGEAPGNTEVSRKLPFVGQAGRLLRVALRAAGIDPDEEVYYTNSVLCHPPGNKTPGIAQVKACRTRLEQELALIAPKRILTVGGTALTAIMRSDKAVPITRWHGRGIWTEWGGRLVYTLATYHPAAVLRDSDYFRDFGADIEKWAKYDSPMPDMSVSFVVPSTLGIAVRCLAAIEELHDLTIDLETTGPDPIVDRIISVGIGNDVSGVIINPFLLRVPLMKKMLKRYLQTYAGEYALWNAKFDIQFLDVYFNEYIRPRAVDGMLQHYLLDERPISGKYRSHGLKAQARIRYDAEDYDFDFSQPLTRARFDDLYLYQAKDLGYTSRLKRDQAVDMDAESPQLRALLHSLLMPATYTLAEVELHGVRIDQPYLQELGVTTRKAIDEKEASLQAIALKHGMEKFNPASQPQLSKLIYNHWKMPKPILSGKRAMEMPADTTAKDVLLQMSIQAKDPAIKRGLIDIIELRLLKKTLATYIDGILEKLGPDGRIRSDFRLLGTSTGRLSSADPNLQNIPLLMGPAIRNAFIPSPGYVWVAADYCVAPDTLVLKSDLTWVDASKLNIGDELIGFPEDSVGHGTRGNDGRLRGSKITGLLKRKADCVMVTTDRGQIICSTEHRLVRGSVVFKHGKPRTVRACREWVKAKDLHVDDTLSFIWSPWLVDETKEASYLAGFFDGEGWVHNRTVGFGQNPGETADHVLKLLAERGFEMVGRSFGKYKCVQHRVSGLSDSMRLVGSIRPRRLLGKAREQMWEGRRAWGKNSPPAHVLGVEHLGERDVISIRTETNTFIAEGFLSHNSQLELRVAAVLTDDEDMKDVFRNGRDIHAEVASMIFKKPADTITKQERVMAKHIDFGIIYGRSAQSLVDGAELEYKDPDAEWWSVDDAELFLYRFLNGFPKLKAWIEKTKLLALKQQYIESPLGRRRRWPFIPPGTANGVGREAVNFPIQGTASDICLDAMVKLHDQLPKGAYVLFPIHDSINFEVREDILEPVLQQIYQTMTSSKLLQTDVPFDVEIEVGQRWGETTKWKPSSRGSSSASTSRI